VALPGGEVSRPKIVGLTRVRNESEMIRDTLDHFGQWCDGGIIVYDDRSTDDTVSLAASHPAVNRSRHKCECVCKKIFERKDLCDGCKECVVTDGVIQQFEPWSPDRTREEWRHRQILLEAGRTRNPHWFLYFDCDERLEWDGKLPESPDVDALSFKLLDAYITNDDAHLDWRHRTKYGPEYRDIVFLYRNLPEMRYFMPDQRIVFGWKNAIDAGYCKHYGKAKSVKEWEATCKYYARWFPEPYKTKWRHRLGHAVHAESDFGRPLVSWEDAKKSDVCIGHLPRW